MVGLLSESRGQNPVLTVLYVPSSLDSGILNCKLRSPAGCDAHLSHAMYELSGSRKSTPPQNRQLIVCYYYSKQCVDDFVRQLTFLNHVI